MSRTSTNQTARGMTRRENLLREEGVLGRYSSRHPSELDTRTLDGFTRTASSLNEYPEHTSSPRSYASLRTRRDESYDSNDPIPSIESYDLDDNTVAHSHRHHNGVREDCISADHDSRAEESTRPRHGCHCDTRFEGTGGPHRHKPCARNGHESRSTNLRHGSDSIDDSSADSADCGASRTSPAASQSMASARMR